ncbi:MAG TPA: hypothetical protein VE442_01310 [Jatrophihabitans sp.]|jgi:hypothetical protein|nr:hypothetical protein [Jatrophihabitans sp.]
MGLQTLSTTRLSLHRLAEHVLAAALYRETGRIDLRPHPGGIATPVFGADQRTIAVELGALVVRTATSEKRARVTTLRTAAAVAGVEPGLPASAYPPATSCPLEAPLVLERSAMQVLADWYMLGHVALNRLRDELAGDEPTEAILWPEHLDVGITAGAINYGFSPGDDFFDQPYAYVGPNQPPKQTGFWNAPFGAYRPMSDVSSVDDAVAFLLEGRDRAMATSQLTRRNA